MLARKMVMAQAYLHAACVTRIFVSNQCNVNEDIRQF